MKQSKNFVKLTANKARQRNRFALRCLRRYVYQIEKFKGEQMKTMNCKQLGGSCDEEFHADTFEEMAELSKQHGTEMYQKQEASHLEAMKEMQELMKNPEDMERWFESKRREFDSLPEN